jgi:hypothetical protein
MLLGVCFDAPPVQYFFSFFAGIVTGAGTTVGSDADANALAVTNVIPFAAAVATSCFCFDCANIAAVS